MKSLRRLLRLMTINWVFLRHGLDEFIFAIHLFRPLRVFYHLAPWNWFRSREVGRAVRLRRALEDLGPIFIKFGQMLSTRRDLIPPDLAQELAKLQDRVPPFPSDLSRRIIEKAMGKPVGEVFAAFETEPMASASIAQVHAAVLKDGRQVVVKVVRPGIEKIIRRDIELLYIIARLAQKYWPEGRRLRPIELVEEYEKTITDELDLMREAANASQLRRNFEGSKLLYVPSVEWDLTSERVMVMERIYGVPISNISSLSETQVDRKVLAERGVEIFFTQVFRHNFFHADMHPGNIFVDITRPEAPRYIAVDFGIVGSLTPSDQRYLAENFYAFFRRDYKRVAELHVESGWVPPQTRVNDFESAIRTVCEPIFERPLKEISFGHFLVRLFQTARRFHMEVQPQLVLLQKTLLNIEGLGRDLYPDLDLWATAKPFIERWMHEQVGLQSLVKGLKTHLPRFLERLPETPVLIQDVMHKAAHNQWSSEHRSPELRRLEHTLRRSLRRNNLLIIGATLFVGGLFTLESTLQPEWLGLPWLSWALAIAGAGCWMAALRE